ncbi:hypothetical protein AC578_6865 [Pseudocercospora eumusae]|uniref:Uncharacterized protein n=1 Tax=Pseudocercospora eumusae TaxID=321146 RepID=A0A139GZ69_9PEZI|nr:hypothetical protein AC578_6865 [Pseudocercospora eumusae]
MDTLPDTLANDQTRDLEDARNNIRDGEDRPADDRNLQEAEMEELKQQDSGSIDEEDEDSRSDEMEGIETQVNSKEEDEAGSDDGDSDASSEYEEIDPEMGPLAANRPAGPLSEAQREYNSFVTASSPIEANHMASGSAPHFPDSQADPEPEEDRPRTPEDQVAITEVEPDFTPRTARRLKKERERGYDRRFRPRSAVAFANNTIASPRFPALLDQARRQADAEEARLRRQARAIPAPLSWNGHEDRGCPRADPSNQTDSGSSRSPSPMRSGIASQGPENETSQGDEIDSAPSSAFSDDSDSDDDDDDTPSVEVESDEDEQSHEPQDDSSQGGDLTASIAAATVEPDSDRGPETLPSGESLGSPSLFAQVGATLAVPTENIISTPPLSPVRTEFAKLESVPEEPDDSPLNPFEYYPRFADANDSPEVSPQFGESESTNTKGKTPLYLLQYSGESAAPKRGESSDDIKESSRRSQQHRDKALLRLVHELKDQFLAQLPRENVDNIQLQLSTAIEERDRQTEKSERYKEACEKLKKQVHAAQEKANQFDTYVDDLQDRVQSLEGERRVLKYKNASLEKAVAENKVVDAAQRKDIYDYREMNRNLCEHIEKLNHREDPQDYKRRFETQREVIADLEEELQHVSADLRKQERQHKIEIQEQRDQFANSQSEVKVWMEQHVSEYKRTLEEKDNEIEELKLQLSAATHRTASENDIPAITVQRVPERVKAQPGNIDAVLANASYNAKPPQPLPAPPLPGVPEPKLAKSPLSPLPIAPSDPQPWQDRVRDWRQTPEWQAQREALRQRRLAEAAHEEQYQSVKRAAYAVTFEKALPEREGDEGLTEKKNRLAFYENIRIRPKLQAEKPAPSPVAQSETQRPALSPMVQPEPKSEVSPSTADPLSVLDSASFLRTPLHVRGYERVSDFWED